MPLAPSRIDAIPAPAAGILVVITGRPGLVLRLTG